MSQTTDAALRHAWYKLDDLPPGTVHGIEWRWPGYEVKGATTTDKRGNRYFYEVRRDKSLKRLPHVPDAWRPDPANHRWTWPGGVAPEPLRREVVPRLATLGGVAFAAVSSAELAAEMEANREAARATHGNDPLDEPPQWWRDVWRIEYQAMGGVTRDMAEARIMRFLILERSIRMDIEAPRTNAAVLADLKRTLADVLADRPEVDWVPPLKPTAEDHCDFETVGGWLVEVMPSRREMGIMRARMGTPPETWDAIGATFRRSREAARTLYNATIDVLADVANRPARRARARRTELQERNRAFKRGRG